MVRPVFQVEPSGLTLKLKSSLPSKPINARAENPVLKAKAASLAAAALLTVTSIPAPALFRRTAGAFSDRRLVASAVAPPRPSNWAVRLACGIPTAVTALANVTVGVFTTVVPPAPDVAEPMLTTVFDPDAPPVPRFTVLVTPVVVAPVPKP